MDFNAALAFIVKVPVARRWNDRTAQLLRRHVRKNKLSYEIARGIVEQLETKEYWIIQAVTVANDVTIVFSRWTVQAERPCVTPSARPLLPQSPMKISTFRKYTLTQSTKKWRKYRWKKKKIYSDSRCVTNSWEFVDVTHLSRQFSQIKLLLDEQFFCAESICVSVTLVP